MLRWFISRSSGCRRRAEAYWSATPSRVALTVLFVALAALEAPVRLFGQGFVPQIIQLTDTSVGDPFVRLLGTSRDGSRVVFWTDGRLMSVRSDGSSLIQISPSSLNVVFQSHFGSTVSHFGGSKAVFVGCQSPCGWSNLGQPGNLFVVNADGTGLTQLTTDGDGVGVAYEGARISADGLRIIFVRSDFFRTYSLYVMNSDGTNQQPLSVPQVGVLTLLGGSSLSSNGSVLAYPCVSSVSGEFNRICLINTDGTGFREFTDGGAPILSGDATMLVYASLLPPGLAVIRTDGTGFRVLDSRPAAGWSIDYNGSVICYAPQVGYQSFEVSCVNADGTNLRDITNAGAWSSLPAISENGAVVAFISNADLDLGKNTDGTWEVFAVRLRSSSTSALHIDARANLWGAGGQGAANVGGGIDPPGVTFTATRGQVLTFSNVTGTTQVGCGGPSWGPDGDLAGSDGLVPAMGQISGVNYNRGCSLPLFGVFLGPSLPAVPPPSLDFTQIGYSFSDLSPELGQLFFIGDGLTGTGSGATQRFPVPVGATRLYLGVLDGPRFWDDNSGALDATFSIAPQVTPRITSVTPDSGPVTGGTLVTITGSGFVDGATLTFDSAPATVLGVEPNAMVAVTPAHATGVVDVLVTNPDGETGVLPSAFTYIAPPPPPVPTISISDASVIEGQTGTVGAVFRVALSAATTVNVFVAYGTADRTARIGDNDYSASTGILTFAPGDTSKELTVLVNGDMKPETNEFFEINLTDAVNGLLGQSQGVGSIINDDFVDYVVLVHGWCGSPASFGNMAALLSTDLNARGDRRVYVRSFDYAGPTSLVRSTDDRKDLRKLAGHFATFVRALKLEPGARNVDVVAHSMGGLIARAWIAGLATSADSSSITYGAEIRSLVTAGTPHFGVDLGNEEVVGVLQKLVASAFCRELLVSVAEAQTDQMKMGSTFIRLLNEQWDEKIGQTVSSSQILTIVGCAPPGPASGLCIGDKLVNAASAALPVPVAAPDYQLAYVKRKHFNDIVLVTDPSHETYQLIVKFLKEGNVSSAYVPSSVNGLVVARFEYPDGRPYNRLVLFPPRLPACQGRSRSLFVQVSPTDSTGWWTLTNVTPGSWHVGSVFPNAGSACVDVAPGRPSVSPKFIVR